MDASAAATAQQLAGFRVLDASTSLGAAFCTSTLQSMGADVERVRISGGGSASTSAFLDSYLSDSELYRAYLKRADGVRPVDGSTAEGVAELVGLLQQVDVFIEDGREPLLPALGIDLNEVVQGKRAPIMVSITPHGRSGPRRDDLASDLTVFHGAGPGHATPGLVEDPATMGPLRLGSHQGSFVTGLVAAINVTAAIFMRSAGESSAALTVDVSAHEALANSYRQSLGTFAYYGGGLNRDLARGRGAGGMADNRNLKCRDGYFTLAWGGVQQWDSLKGALGDPAWMDDPDFETPVLRFRNWARIVPRIEEWAADKDKEYLVFLFQGFRIPSAAVNDGADLQSLDVFESRSYWSPTTVDGRNLRIPPTPGSLRIG